MRFSFSGRSPGVPISFLLPVFALLVALGGSCARPPKSDPSAARAAIESGDREFMRVFSARDAKAISLIYTQDAKLLPPNEEPVLGREAIEKYWGGVLQLPIDSVSIQTAELHGNGDEMTAEGRYAMIGPNGETVETGKFLVVWRKSETGWQMYRDMWSSNAPSTAPASPDTLAATAKG